MDHLTDDEVIAMALHVLETPDDSWMDRRRRWNAEHPEQRIISPKPLAIAWRMAGGRG